MNSFPTSSKRLGNKATSAFPIPLGLKSCEPGDDCDRIAIDSPGGIVLRDWGVRGRAMVSVHTFAMTRPAFKSMDPAEDGFTSDVARWLHNGQNTLSVVLMGPLPLEMRLRMEVAQDGQAAWLLDETDMLLIATPCRLWNQTLGKSTAPPAEMQAGRLLTNC